MHAARAYLAIQDDFARAVERRHLILEFAQGHQASARNSRDLPLPLFANVDELNIVSPANSLVELTRADFVDCRLAVTVAIGIDSAECVIIDELANLSRSARGTFRVTAQLYGSKLHRERIDEEQPPDERLTRTEYQLHGFCCLNRSYQARENSEHSGFSTARHKTRGRRLTKKAPIAWAFTRREDRSLAFEFENAAERIRFAEYHARVIDEVARWKIVSAVDDHVVVARDLERVVRRERHVVALDLHVRVDVANAIGRGVELRSPDIARPVDYLALEVGDVDGIEVDETQRSNACGSEIKCGGRSEAACTYEEDLRCFQFFLAFSSDLVQYEVAAVAS